MNFSKPQQVPDVIGVDDIGPAFREWALIQSKIDEVEAAINEKMNLLKDELQRKVAPLDSAKLLIESRILDFCEKNDHAVFGDKASREFQFGVVKRTTSEKSVVNADPEQPNTVELLLKLSKTKREQLLKTEHKPIASELKKLDPDEQAKYNFRVDKKTNYTATPNKITLV